MNYQNEWARTMCAKAAYSKSAAIWAFAICFGFPIFLMLLGSLLL